MRLATHASALTIPRNGQLGAGGIKSNVVVLGADQFRLPEQEEQQASYFNFFYCASANAALDRKGRDGFLACVMLLSLRQDALLLLSQCCSPRPLESACASCASD